MHSHAPHPPGRLTLPRVSLMAREAQAKELAAIASQPLLPGIATAPAVRRLRAGMAAPLSLPSL